jgi:hypothetical protein
LGGGGSTTQLPGSTDLLLVIQQRSATFQSGRLFIALWVRLRVPLPPDRQIVIVKREALE